MRTLAAYLQTIKEGIKRDRVRSTLTKTVNADGNLTTEAALVERFAREGAELRFYSMTGKKRDGLRLPLKPSWSIFHGDRGFGISRTAALYANYLLGDTSNVSELEARVKSEYERAIADSKPPRVLHGW